MQAVFGLADSFQADFAAEDDHGLKQRRRVFASADGDADGLKHRPGLQAQMSGGGAQRLVERIVIEGGCGQDLLRRAKNAQRESGIAFLRDQLGWIVGREFLTKKKSAAETASRSSLMRSRMSGVTARSFSGEASRPAPWTFPGDIGILRVHELSHDDYAVLESFSLPFFPLL